MSLVDYHWLIYAKMPSKGPEFSVDEWDELIGEYEKAEIRGRENR